MTIDWHELDLEATKTGNWEPVLGDLESILKSLDARMPTGQLRMKRAVLRSRTAMTVEAALAELDAVQLTPDDHAWLEDIRTLARAELFHRFDLLIESRRRYRSSCRVRPCSSSRTMPLTSAFSTTRRR